MPDPKFAVGDIVVSKRHGTPVIAVIGSRRISANRMASGDSQYVYELTSSADSKNPVFPYGSQAVREEDIQLYGRLSQPCERAGVGSEHPITAIDISTLTRLKDALATSEDKVRQLLEARQQADAKAASDAATVKAAKELESKVRFLEGQLIDARRTGDHHFNEHVRFKKLYTDEVKAVTRMGKERDELKDALAVAAQKQASHFKEDGYDSLRGVFDSAVRQASEGKGHERHVGATDEPFEEQSIVRFGLIQGSADFALGQMAKKALEASRMDCPDAMHEILGALNYGAAAYLTCSALEHAEADDGGDESDIDEDDTEEDNDTSK